MMRDDARDLPGLRLLRDEEGRRYSAVLDGAQDGAPDGAPVVTAEFLLTPDLVVFTHTVVAPGPLGERAWPRLVRWALDDARARGYQVLASCPLVRGFVAEHAGEYADLVRQPAPADVPRLR